MKIDRRSFLRATPAAAGVAALGGLGMALSEHTNDLNKDYCTRWPIKYREIVEHGSPEVAKRYEENKKRPSHRIHAKKAGRKFGCIKLYA